MEENQEKNPDEIVKTEENETLNDTKEVQKTDEIDKSEEEKITLEEEKAENDSPLKKYIFNVSKDFTNVIDGLTIDERTAYINDAIQMKIDSNNSTKQSNKFNEIITQAVIVFLTVCIVTPVAIFIMNKAIMITFENYKYSQTNFEKLYKQRFEKDRAYMRSLQYNQNLKERKNKGK